MNGDSFPSRGSTRVASVQRTNKKSIEQKSENQLLFSGLEYKGSNPQVLTAEERTNMSALL